RTHAGFELPAAGTWTIDPTHADVSFVGRHFMLTKVRGRFTALSGAIDIADDPAQSRLDVTIDMASVASGDPGRDDHLRSAELFDVERFPTASYRSTAVEWQGSAGQVTGELTIKGISRPVTLSVEYVGHAADPWGNERAVFSAWAFIDREQWGITWNAVLETGGLLVSKEIRLEIEVEAILQP
ncbi:MAG: YceI family protein, partial [Ilumatobacteraceae bacterium]